MTNIVKARVSHLWTFCMEERKANQQEQKNI